MNTKNYPMTGLFLLLGVASLLLSAHPTDGYASTKPRKNYKGEVSNVCKNNVCNPFRLFASGIGGGAWAHVGKSQSFTDDSTLYSYNATTDTQSQWLWGASVGEELRFYPEWAVQAAISYYQTSAFQGKGTLTQGVDVDSAESYNYNYSVTSRQYLFELKFLGDMASGMHPYASAGVGASFNSFSDYDVNLVTPFPFSTFTPEYPSYTNTSFSYAVGVGVDVDISPHARLGIGYRYAWLGSINSGNGEINTAEISQSLEQGNLNASEAIVQLTLIM